MRHLLLFFFAMATTFMLQAQTFEFYISDPDPVPEPLEFCMNEELTFTHDYTDWGTVTWWMSTEEPDITGQSNYDAWEIFDVSGTTYTHSVTEGVYIWLSVQEGWGPYVFSDAFHITLAGVPVTIPESIVLCEGSEIILTAEGDVFDTYQWYKDEVLIADATTSTYTVDDEGDYHVEVTSDACPAAYPSNTCTVIFYVPVTEIDVTNYPTTVVLSTPDAGIAYQWLSGSSADDLTEIDGETNQTLTFEPLTTSMHYAVITHSYELGHSMLFCSDTCSCFLGQFENIKI